MSPWIPLSAAAVLALLVAERMEWRPGIVLAKLAAAGCFLAFALECGALESDYGRLLLLGLALCALGDALLLPLGQTLWFQLGIGAFLLGHLAYAVAFIRLGISPLALVASAAILAFAALRVLGWLRPHIPAEFKIAVGAYIVVISAMVASAFAATAADTTAAPGVPAIAIGAVLFAASDLSVARERFVQAGFINSAWGLPAYFGSQMILASTAGMAIP